VSPARPLQGVSPLIVLLIATTFEVSGDAVVRIAIYHQSGLPRLGLMLAGVALLLGYGSFLNLAPLEFGRVVGLYIATLFVVWQVINFVAFRATPTIPIVIGGAFIIVGGAIITFWRTAQCWRAPRGLFSARCHQEAIPIRSSVDTRVVRTIIPMMRCSSRRTSSDRAASNCSSDCLTC
jgi:hypothetical protein